MISVRISVLLSFLSRKSTPTRNVCVCVCVCFEQIYNLFEAETTRRQLQIRERKYLNVKMKFGPEFFEHNEDACGQSSMNRLTIKREEKNQLFWYC